MKGNLYCWVLLWATFVVFVSAGFEPRVIETHEEPAFEYLHFEDSPNILAVKDTRIKLSTDSGETWKEIDGFGKKRVTVKLDDTNSKMAFALTASSTQYFTIDRGITWNKFVVDDFKGRTEEAVGSPPQIISNFGDENSKLVSYSNCEGYEHCIHKYLYTTDLFKTKLKPIKVDVSRCTFARGSKGFEKGEENTIICIQDHLNSFGHVVSSDLVRTDDFFETSKVLKHAYSKTGRLLEVRVVQDFIVGVVQNDKFNENSKVSLLISKDANTFDLSDVTVGVVFGIFGSYDFLDSPKSAIFLSTSAFSEHVIGDTNSKVYASDTSGLRFKTIAENVVKHSMQNVQPIDGVWLANMHIPKREKDEDKNKDKDKSGSIDIVIGGRRAMTVRSQITFNDGKDWSLLKVLDEDCTGDCSLHLKRPARLNGGTIPNGRTKLVTAPYPGILFGIGNTGNHLIKDYDNMSSFFSRDGGVTWKKTIDEACIFSFADLGNIVVAIPYYERHTHNDGQLFDDDNSTVGKNASLNHFYYSIDQGVTFTKKEFDTSFTPECITTTIDGTGTHFLVSGLKYEHPDNHEDSLVSRVTYSLDFSKAYEGKCKESDFEEVYARQTVEDKKALCMHGHREKFKRRKVDSKCFAASLNEDVTVYDEPCECTVFDFECAPGFKLDKKGKICEPDKAMIVKMCKTKKVKEIKLPNKVLADGNDCSLGKKSPKDFITEHTLKCSDYIDKGGKTLKKIDVHRFDFEGKNKVVEYSYFEQGQDYEGENILVRTEDNKLYASKDGGIDFVKVPTLEDIESYSMGYVPGQVVLATDTKRIYISNNSGNSYMRVDAPGKLVPPYVSFDRHHTRIMIVYVLDSEGNCSGNNFDVSCKKNAYKTYDLGESFELLRKGVSRCDLVYSFLKEQTGENGNLIHCSSVDFENKKIDLVSSNNNFKDETSVAKNIVGYAVSGGYVVVGVADEKKSRLKAMVTSDGITFADAKIPHNLDINVEQPFTVLDSETGSIFLHVTTQGKEGFEYGAILKSNFNGTSYALSLANVNRNSVGYVDYDRIEGIEGILISNVVSNYKDSKNKKLKTMISHSDGGEWQYIRPPSKDSKGKAYKCSGKSVKECSLNLHGFTERADYRDTFSSPSAIGLMIGLGNVGPYLTDKDKSDTFMTRDGGVTWAHLRHGKYMWEYGDRGSILVLVKDGETNKVSYSLDQGHKWTDYEFSKEEVTVTDIATVPSDNSMKFLIFTRKGKSSVFTLDFSNIYDRQCQLDLDNPDDDDFEYWSPKDPEAEAEASCLFGHEAKYLRRAKGHEDCFIGKAPLKDGFKITKNCGCTREDYECDYNYWRDSDNTCKLVKGLSPSDRRKEMCRRGAFEYFEPSGYRKVPLSTCVGGKQFDSFVPKACPGKVKEFDEHYGRDIGFGKLSLLIIIPVGIFFFATWFMYDRGIRRNGGLKHFGQIRLDDDEFDFHPIENNQVDKAVNTIVKGVINTAAFCFATSKVLRKVDIAVCKNLLGRLFGGSDGRRYVNVPDLDEEDELCGNRDDYEDDLDGDEESDHGDEESDNGDERVNGDEREHEDFTGVQDQFNVTAEDAVEVTTDENKS